MESAIYKQSRRQVFEFKGFRCSVFDFKGLSGDIEPLRPEADYNRFIFAFIDVNVKRKTARIRSKTDKILVQNIVVLVHETHELGIEPMF
jgi:hypothetical protein